MTAVIHEGLMATAINEGLNFWPIFEARRQLDQPRSSWFWADYLHYVGTGKFVRELFLHSVGKPNFQAFAYGYLTHYITDVVGHPFVNHVVGSPWRMYFQRHHLVENFSDAYIWDRWHASHPGGDDADTGEQPLIPDSQCTQSGIRNNRAPFTFARLHDHLNIEIVVGQDPVDQFIQSICDNIRNLWPRWD